MCVSVLLPDVQIFQNSDILDTRDSSGTVPIQYLPKHAKSDGIEIKKKESIISTHKPLEYLENNITALLIESLRFLKSIDT